MKLDKQIIHGIILRWMRSDEKLLKNLHPNHVRILCERLIEEKSFKELGKEYRLTPSTTKRAFKAVLNRVQLNFGNGIYSLFTTINDELENEAKSIRKAIRTTPTKNYQWN